MTKTSRQRYNTETALAAAITAYRKMGNKINREPAEGQPDNKGMIIEFLGNATKANLPLEEATAMRGTIASRLTINMLTGAKGNEFFNKIANLVNADVVSARDFGLLAWAPKLCDDLERADTERANTLSIAAGSRYIGAVNTKIDIQFTLLTCRFLQTYHMFIHNGHDENGNLVSFFSKTKFESGVKINGRVKKHETNRYLGGSRVTVLNYVKAVA